MIRCHDETWDGQRAYVMVMPRADCNLLQAIQTERFAGHDLNHMAAIARDVALALQEMHDKGWVHADVKPRNVVRIGGRWCVQILKTAVIQSALRLFQRLSVLNALSTPYTQLWRRHEA